MKENKEGLSEVAKTRVRIGIYPMAGIYLIYLAYCMHQEIGITSGGKQISMIVFCILFSIIGVAMNILGLYMAHRLGKDLKEDHGDEEQSEE